MPETVMSRRRSGILLHPTSLPSGRLDDDAVRWLDFLACAGQSVWQVLPLGMPCCGHSPYQCLSAFALNPALARADPGQRQAEFPQGEFRAWCRQQAGWLGDFADFRVIRRLYDGKAWYDWPPSWRDRDHDTLARLHREYADELDAVRFEQFVLDRDWQAVREAAHARGIYLFGDMPIFVAHDSADVWCCRQRFLLDDSGQLKYATGVPPDYFSATGQRWGNPHYDWAWMQAHGFKWWLQRLEAHFRLFDLVRIDHFRGLEAVWMIEPGCDTAVEGHWQPVPGRQLLTALEARRGAVPVVAEDLGIITPEVTRLRRDFGLPGMAVLQFSFDEHADNPHKPCNIAPDTVVYTGTHDNDTTRGWFESLPADQRQSVLDVLGTKENDVVNAMIGAALESRAQLAVIPLQDVLGLGTEARMNLPGSNGDHWRWRLDWSQLTGAQAGTLKEMSVNAGRC